MTAEPAPITFAERLARIDARQAALRECSPAKPINPGLYLLSGFALGAGGLLALLLALGARF